MKAKIGFLSGSAVSITGSALKIGEVPLNADVTMAGSFQFLHRGAEADIIYIKLGLKGGDPRTVSNKDFMIRLSSINATFDLKHTIPGEIWAVAYKSNDIDVVTSAEDARLHQFHTWTKGV